MKKNSLVFNEVKKVSMNGETLKIEAKVRLDDNCNNGICFFHVTGDIYRLNESGYYEDYICGAIGDYAEMAEMISGRFNKFHGRTRLGYNTGLVSNLNYYIKRGDKDYAMRYAMLNEDEYKVLSFVADEKEYFKYLLFDLGIMDRMKREADAAIKKLEELTGDTWVNPYSPEKERHTIVLTPEEKKLVEDRIEAGYYTEPAIEERRLERIRVKREKEKKSVIDDFEKKLKELEYDRNVRLALIDFDIFGNVIYYKGSNKISFNWSKSWDKIPEEKYKEFVENVDRSKLPEGVTFEYNKL